MSKSIYDYVKVVRRAIDPDTRARILELSETCDWELHHWTDPDTGGTKQRTDGTELSVAYPNSDELTNLMMFPVAHALKMYADKINPQAWVSNTSVPRFNKYSVNTDMAEHADHITSLFVTDEESRAGIVRGIPVMSIVAVLTDDYTGGEFIFNGEKKIELNAGDILLFPSAFPWAHKVTPIKGGTRVSYVSWAY